MGVQAAGGDAAAYSIDGGNLVTVPSMRMPLPDSQWLSVGDQVDLCLAMWWRGRLDET